MGKTLRNIHKALFFGLIVLLPTQLGYHFWPEWATVLGRRVDYLSPMVYLTDVLIFIVLLFWFVESFSRFTNYDLRITRNTKQKSLFIILLFLFIFLNIFFAPSRPVATYKWLKVLEFVALGFYIIKTKPSLSLISSILYLPVLFSSLLAIAQFFLQHSVGGPLWLLGERTFTVDTPGIAKLQSCQLSAVSCQLLLRPYATFPHPNVLGGYIAAVMPLLISNFKFLISNQTKKIPIIKLVTIILGVIALVLTFSRSAIVVGAIGVGWAYYVLRKRKNHFVFSILPYTILIILLGTLLLRTIDINDESIVVRNQLNTAAIKLFQQSPIIGIGLGNFLVELPKALPSRTIYFLQPAHNIYLLVLAETGIVGLGLFLWVLWIAIRNKGKAISKKGNPVAFSYLLSLISYLLLGLADHYPLTLQQGQLLLTILLAIAIREKR